MRKFIPITFHSFGKLSGLWMLIFCLFCAQQAAGQTFGNEWINNNQEYYKLQLADEGIYQLTYADLQAAGFPVEMVDPKKIQLFHKGEEQAIYFNGEADARFDAGDYLLFYGQKNKGQQDEELYPNPSERLNVHYSLFSDSTAYFLTWAKDASRGLRMTTNNSENNVTGMTAEDFHWAEKLEIYTNHYVRGQHYPRGVAGSETLLSSYDTGEGWSGSFVQQNRSADYMIEGISNLNINDNPTLSIRLAGRNNQTHRAEILAGPDLSTLRSLQVFGFDYYGAYQFEQTLLPTDISEDGKLIVRLKVYGVDGKRDAVSVSSIQLKYPQNFIINGGQPLQHFELKPDTDGKSYIEINNVANNTLFWDITNPSRVVRITNPVNSGTLKAVVSNTTSARKLIASVELKNVPWIKKANLKTIDPTLYNYLIVTNPVLRQAASDGNDPVEAYSNYRKSIDGGGYSTLIVNMEELYDQFSYGERTPLALRRFAAYMLNGGDPAHLFLIGKGITFEDDGVVGNGYGQNTFLRKEQIVGNYQNLVPSYGEPGSDVAITAGLNGTTYQPAIPTGRLSANNPEHILNYLLKVKEAEAFPFDDLWKKDILHLSGGQSPYEVDLFKRYTDQFKAVAEQPYLSGKVTTVQKQTTSSVELINIADKINEGTALVTFFGHAATNVVDIEIGLVSDPLMGYANKGKYPFILVNGCNAGDIFTTNFNFTDDWMLSKDLGSIGFLAHSNVGFSTNLRAFTQFFYETAYADSSLIHRSVGEIQQETIRKFHAYKGGFTSERDISQMQQMVLQGDPAIKLFGTNKPDYASSSDDILVKALDGTEKVTAETGQFALGIITRNYGLSLNDSLTVGVTRTFPDGNSITYDTTRFKAVGYQDTLWVDIPNNSGLYEQGGINSFSISLDYAGDFEEINELNNEINYSFYMASSGVENLLPLDFAMTGSPRADLWVQTIDRLAINQTFELQLDTVPTFDSPYKRDTLISAHSLAHWPATLLPDDKMIYYWRSRLQSENDWLTRSFQYIQGAPEGWTQAEAYQFKQNEIKGLVNQNGIWNFRNEQIDLEVSTHGALHPESSSINSVVNIDGLPLIVNSYSNRICRSNSLNFVAFTQANKEPYAAFSSGGHEILDSRRCGRVPQVINNFRGSEITGINSLVTQYVNQVTDGDYVLVFSIGTVDFEGLPDQVKSDLEQLGADRTVLDNLQNGQPYILFGQKGAGSATAIEITGTDNELIAPASPIVLDVNYTSGYFFTDKIGPAAAWDKVMANLQNMDPTSDQATFDVIGVNKDNQEVPLIQDSDLTEIDLSSINAAEFPHLKLKWKLSDTVNFTAPQPLDWQVQFESLPEGVVYLQESSHDKLGGLKKQEGETEQVDFAFKNISNKTFADSLAVTYGIQNLQDRSSDSSAFRLSAPLPGEDAAFQLDIGTLEKTGDNNLFLSVNAKELPEMNLKNDAIFWQNFMNVESDTQHPLLDVTFDGEYIMDGDIVAPQPYIRIEVKDENKILLKEDTTGLDILLKDLQCENCMAQRISLSDPAVKWFPAEKDQDFRIEYQPEKLQDGRYQLIVQAEDGSGNKSGTKPYQVNFEVVTESAITHFYPYPNPFSTNTRFIFTLTGSVIPDEIKIQIMTVTGKVVREITQDELGPLRIGNNVSEYAWDGRDEYGDVLANGVYLYRVILRSAGQEMKRRTTAADDRAFKNDFGKLYILR